VTKKVGDNIAFSKAATGRKGIVEIRSFPDGETYVRIISDVK
jgi:phosphoribosylpyrophosphate synthetase